MSIEFINEIVAYDDNNPVVYDIEWEGESNKLHKAILKNNFLNKSTELNSWIKVDNISDDKGEYNFICLPKIKKVLAVYNKNISLYVDKSDKVFSNLEIMIKLQAQN